MRGGRIRARPRLIAGWQLYPRVWDHLRREADASGQAGQFLLTGSSSPADDGRSSPVRSTVRRLLDQIAHVDISVVPDADGRQPARRRDPKKVLTCIRSLARYVATAVGRRSIATDTGLSREAVADYLEALGRLMILEEQPAFDVHLRSSRNLRTTPHRHLVDPSLATAALQVDADGLLRDLGRDRGRARR